jgi:hypothetical protein
MPWPPPLFEEFSAEVGCGNPGHKNGGAQGKLSSRDKGQLEEKVPPPVSPGGAETEKLIRPTPHLPGPEPAGGSCDMVAEVVLGEEGTGPILVKNLYFNPDAHLTPNAFLPAPPGRGETNVTHGGHSPINPHWQNSVRPISPTGRDFLHFSSANDLPIAQFPLLGGGDDEKHELKPWTREDWERFDQGFHFFGVDWEGTSNVNTPVRDVAHLRIISPSSNSEEVLGHSPVHPFLGVEPKGRGVKRRRLSARRIDFSKHISDWEWSDYEADIEFCLPNFPNPPFSGPNEFVCGQYPHNHRPIQWGLTPITSEPPPDQSRHKAGHGHASGTSTPAGPAAGAGDRRQGQSIPPSHLSSPQIIGSHMPNQILPHKQKQNQIRSVTERSYGRVVIRNLGSGRFVPYQLGKLGEGGKPRPDRDVRPTSPKMELMAGSCNLGLTKPGFTPLTDGGKGQVMCVRRKRGAGRLSKVDKRNKNGGRGGREVQGASMAT